MPTIIDPSKFVFKADSSSLAEFKLKTIYPRLGEITQSKHFMFDIRNLESGLYSFPFHFHHNSEELILILSGSMTLRTIDGLKIVNKNELVFFESGETSTHQFYNHSAEPCIYLDIRTTPGLDVVEYPDSGKVNISPLKLIFDKNTQVGYNKGEENISGIWKDLKI